MLASLYSLFGDMEKYDNRTGTIIGLIILLIGLIIMLLIYSMYLVDESMDNYPERKADFLRAIVVKGVVY